MANWLWPCPGNTKITSGVGPRWGTTHKGIDISAPEGSAIVASRDGRVTRAEYSSSYGNVVYINHGDGYETRYAHMVELPMVKTDQKVSQGQQIGKVGSTGFSTGNHLHFEIRYKNVIKDPEKYVNPSDTLLDPGYGDEGDIANQYTSDYITGDSVNELTPVMTRDFIKGHPFYSYLKIMVGTKELVYENGKPNIIQSFEINRLEQAGNKAQFVLFDTNWEDIEHYLAENWNNITIQYGYTDGDLSPEYKMLLSDYSVDFKNTGTILSIQAISEGIYQNLNPIESFDTGTKNPSEAIKAICNMMGWEIDLEDFANTKDVDRDENYMILNMSPVTYINQIIIPEARSLDSGDKDETVVFYLDSTKEGKAHLKIKTYESNSDLDDASIPTYVYMKGYDSVIQDLSFHVKGVFGGTAKFQTVTSLSSGLFSTEDKSEKFIDVDQDSALGSASGDYSHTPDQSKVKYITSGETEDQINAILNYHIKNGANQAYEATMVILGDPKIEILQEVRIINVTDTGHLHHTSGIYIVTGISDTIQNGDFKTTLTLRRNADISTGIVLRYPKYKKV